MSNFNWSKVLRVPDVPDERAAGALRRGHRALHQGVEQLRHFGREGRISFREDGNEPAFADTVPEPGGGFAAGGQACEGALPDWVL